MMVIPKFALDAPDLFSQVYLALRARENSVNTTCMMCASYAVDLFGNDAVLPEDLDRVLEKVAHDL